MVILALIPIRDENARYYPRLSPSSLARGDNRGGLVECKHREKWYETYGDAGLLAEPWETAGWCNEVGLIA